ncbi:RdgB/HAM1 family non-canonical purine NTP pyrophosphatase [Calycomorphotria hydatis]|uniref:dITP/XTP pyrophosphatase n=1 Tax=Calycomorphotria hydatis TaxID=2528027 RepID=A0A517TBI4_9PLAN|nr:RdgB/HAM1 family non-canonical purine NTP pyrophosphatase [Calycomorphotria hydatis]QDT65735.1 Non-canonical purine NTP pyrophosphatase [Calycomorphotria hydatis]
MVELVVASRNKGKIREIEELLGPLGFKVRGISEFPDVAETIEDGETFAENAAKKAREAAVHLGRWALGEDSGLCVDALGGRPGIYSARYSGDDATDEKNNAKLMEELADVPDAKRSAHYECHVAVSDETGEIRLTSSGQCCGRIADAPRGENGFGYDPYFLLPEYHRTFGELPAVVKRHLSHRARAFEQLSSGMRSLAHQLASD